MLYKKRPEPPQFNPVTTGQRSGNLSENGIDDLLGVVPTQIIATPLYERLLQRLGEREPRHLV